MWMTSNPVLQSSGVPAHIYIKKCDHMDIMCDLLHIRLDYYSLVAKDFKNLSVFHSTQISLTHTICMSWFL